MKYILLSFIGIIISISGVYKLNEYTWYHYFRGLHPRSASVHFRPDPAEYAKNFYVSSDVKEENGNYEFMFKFRDQTQKDWTWRWSYPVVVTDEMISEFGVPKFVFQPYYPADTAIKRRMQVINKGLFEMENNSIGPDMNKMINYYRPFLEPVSQLAEGALGPDATWRSRAELAIKFVQDIPYSIPPDEQGVKYTGGVFPPPQVFINMFGDCDSKVVLYSSLLSFMGNYEILIMKETGHVLTGIKGIPMPYDKFYEYRNNQYIMAETAGPGRTNLGVITDPYQKISETILVKFE
jgi:hypothetical protein